ncbi:undecaprenyl-phosphate glucose phosphotransferase [Methylobacterium haplocladii]|uniref:Undecaprenyl-phosphate glucose phosphotransferase n=1 Tax=Methylobacterium haplocladii TaxID=1176176 RepID=A0A512IVD5_9HYPH|nr:undecaprenyl-phosphate glucose phosphotransferase [Methylobacterium haplocladii]GEP01559.1 undecaprenyl-phosphate glucose phosphotransferase [Methylobacterium haplocladii]GJD85405.1 UDP-glucose:undecaprenyl-phosphate glucose-1-phosphate transferase [Methylobacterium haplocladii]GLS59372.1 undecaprenyl-phosphate glucose phosphotransferase [Methylobacterium haplocladii]
MSAFGVRDLLDVAGAPGRPEQSRLQNAGEHIAGPPASAQLPAEALAPVLKGPALTPVVLSGCVRGLELVLLAGLGFAIHRIELAGLVPLGWSYIAAIVAIAGLAAGFFQVSGCYRISAFRSIAKTAAKLAVGWTMAFLIVATAMVLAKVADHYSRVWLASFYAGGLGLLALERIGLFVFTGVQMRKGLFDRRTAIVGGGEAAEELIRSLEASADSGIRIVGVFDDRGDIRSNDVVAGHPKLGNVSDLVAYARRARIDLIVFTIPISAETRILQMLAKLWVLPIDIRLSAHATKLRLRPRAYSYLGAVPVLDVFDKPLADWDVVLKNVFDKVVAVLALIALAPVMLAVALAVKLGSKGPVLFKQKRHGFNNELIEVFKFRSMYVDQTDFACAKQVTKGDPRVTAVGRFIRKSSLDELPQLFNVLKGNLSLVGPRPHALQAKAANTLYDQVVDGYFARHKVKPGITGWAQINGWRGETDTSEKLQRRVEHDLYYIENWSILFDLQILATTPFALFKTENAY